MINHCSHAVSRTASAKLFVPSGSVLDSVDVYGIIYHGVVSKEVVDRCV